MENQHRQIKGYRDLSQEEIDLMNEIKAKGAELGELLGKAQSHLSRQSVAAINSEHAGDNTEVARLDQAQPQRWVSISRTHFQEGLMALTRSIAQPTFF